MIGFPLMLIGFRKADVTYKEFSDLVCQHCQGGLYQSKSVIIATGNCPSCGRRVVKDDAIGTEKNRFVWATVFNPVFV